MRKKLILALMVSAYLLTGCAGLESQVNDVVGSIRGNTYTGRFYTNQGDNYMTVNGEKIDMQSNTVKEATYSTDSNGNSTKGYSETLSSVVTITIDGHQIESCGSSIIFEEEGLKPDAEFTEEDVKTIDSESSSLTDNVYLANIINKYKNYFGKPMVVVIQSQLGDPICAYSGKDVYWEVCEDLPKTTKLMVDGKALYIHRANFAIIDKDLLK